MYVKYSHLPDNEQLLIRGCIAGERGSQSKLYKLYAPVMLGVCLRYSKDKQEAEEIMQEGFLRVFRYIHKYRGDGSFEGWIRRIMVNCALLRFKSKSKLHPVTRINIVQQEISDIENTYSYLATKDLLLLVQSLPPVYRIVFNLYVFEGMKHREIATLLDISEGTSKSNLSDAKIWLQKKLVLVDNNHTVKAKGL
jgi:RNA polymerase sigma-70 factor (ECF subfamily)